MDCTKGEQTERQGAAEAAGTEKARYHTVIIGAGPAGLACALTLLEEGVSDILVAEKYRFPRNKCCAGYITRKTEKEYRRFGLDPADCGYSFIRDFRLFFRQKRVQDIENRFLLTSREIDRTALDDAFFRLARARGVRIAEESPITGHDPQARTVTLGKELVVGYDHLVFADGTMGFGSAYQKPGRRNLAMQAVFPSDRPDSIEIHFGVTRRGYCWVSTCGGVTNVGMTDEFRGTAEYRKLFERFLLDRGFGSGSAGLYAAFTPIGVRKPVIGGNIFFAGDALGACDPFTLSGINNGLTSGRKAAQSIARSDPGILRRYARLLGVKHSLMYLLMELFYVRWVRWLVFRVGCRFFSGVVTFFFNRFLNKK